MKAPFLEVIPKSYRARGIFVCLTIFVRALLNFVGIAALLPILYLILDANNMHANPLLEWLYISLGFTSDSSFILTMSAAMVLFIVAKSLVNLLLYRTERDYIYELYRFLSRNLFIDYFNRGLQYIKRTNSAVLSRNVNVVCYTFVVGVLRPIATLVSEALLLGMLFLSIAIYNPSVALLALVVFIPAATLFYSLMRVRLGRYGNIENEAQRRKYRDVIDTYRGYTDIEINNAFDHQLASFDREVDTIIGVGRKNATISMLPQSFTEIGLALGMAILVAYSATSGGEGTKILFGLFAVAALRLLPSVRSIMGAWGALRYNRYTVDILREAKSNSAATAPNRTNERLSFNDKIEVRNIAFRFEDSDHDTLLDFSLTIKKGEKVGINGESGAGKTTLLNLLLGLYTPTEGEIVIDGIALDKSLLRKWQNSIGYVSQGVFLADSTLLSNIALGLDDSEIDMKRIEAAVEAASLSEFVASLPNGLQTRIGECGSLLSGGQRQRIGIARALYKQADILFFDEATSSLDSATEQSINQAIEHLSSSHKNLTIVVVAHRESSLGYCDRIITLEKRKKWSIV